MGSPVLEVAPDGSVGVDDAGFRWIVETALDATSRLIFYRTGSLVRSIPSRAMKSLESI